MKTKFNIKVGQLIGRDHLISRRNKQDALALTDALVNGEKYFAGFVADGCGSSLHSEVGAQLAVRFVSEKTKELIISGVGINRLPDLLFENTLSFLESSLFANEAYSPEDRLSFIKDYLLFTLIGFVQGPEKILVFAYGDGTVVINNDIDFRDQGDAPDYIAYLLVKNSLPQSSLPKSFDIYPILTEDLERLAIGSDSWKGELDLLLNKSIWGIKHTNGLQRKMNTWSDKEHRFKDDASLIVLERVKESD